MKNTGGRFGGAITAALLLQEFIGDNKWMHLDIERYYEIPKIEIPELVGLNVLDAEELAFSSVSIFSLVV